jgi:hypothetical protein
LISFSKAAIWSAISTEALLGIASEFLRVDLMLVIGYAPHNELRPEWV